MREILLQLVYRVPYGDHSQVSLAEACSFSWHECVFVLSLSVCWVCFVPGFWVLGLFRLLVAYCSYDVWHLHTHPGLIRSDLPRIAAPNDLHPHLGHAIGPGVLISTPVELLAGGLFGNWYVIFVSFCYRSLCELNSRAGRCACA